MRRYTVEGVGRGAGGNLSVHASGDGEREECPCIRPAPWVKRYVSVHHRRIGGRGHTGCGLKLAWRNGWGGRQPACARVLQGIGGEGSVHASDQRRIGGRQATQARAELGEGGGIRGRVSVCASDRAATRRLADPYDPGRRSPTLSFLPRWAPRSLWQGPGCRAAAAGAAADVYRRRPPCGRRISRRRAAAASPPPTGGHRCTRRDHWKEKMMLMGFSVGRPGCQSTWPHLTTTTA